MQYYLVDRYDDVYSSATSDLDGTWYDCDGETVELSSVAENYGPLRWLTPGDEVKIDAPIPTGAKVKFSSHAVEPGDVTVSYYQSPPAGSKEGYYILNVRVPASNVWRA